MGCPRAWSWTQQGATTCGYGVGDFVQAFTSGYRGIRRALTCPRSRSHRSPRSPPARSVAFGSLWSLPVTESRPRIVPEATVARLAVYLRVLAGLADGGRSHVSSGELASAAGGNPAGLRKDLSYLGPCGVRGVGYSVARLRDRLTEALGGERSRPCVLVGIGRLGSALADYTGCAGRGFQFGGLLDSDPRTVGSHVGGLPVRPVEELEAVVNGTRASIGVITTPAEVAQSVCD